jgi:hypothetical protein
VSPCPRPHPRCLCSKGPPIALLTHDFEAQRSLYDKLCKRGGGGGSTLLMTELGFCDAVTAIEDLDFISWLQRVFPRLRK